MNIIENLIQYKLKFDIKSRNFFRRNTIGRFGKYANSLAHKHGIEGNGVNDAVDAYRHGYYSEIVSKRLGENAARLLGDLQEYSGGNNSSDSSQDYFNNEKSFMSGSKAKNYSDIESMIALEIYKGNLRTAPGKPLGMDNFGNDSYYSLPTKYYNPSDDSPDLEETTFGRAKRYSKFLGPFKTSRFLGMNLNSFF